MSKFKKLKLECLACGFTHILTRPRECVVCECDNHSMCDAGDGYYTRAGGVDVKLVKITKVED